MGQIGFTRRAWGRAVFPLAASFLLSRLHGQSQTVPTIDERIRQEAANAPLKMRFRGRTAEECRRWQKEFGARLRSLLGPFQPPAEWKTVVENVVEAEDHRRESLVLRAPRHPDLPVYLLTPKPETSNRRRAGIAALHGHGPFGHDAVVGIAETAAERENISEFNYDYGLQLVRRGYVVAAPCFTPFGRRLDDREAYHGADPCAVTFVRLQLLGQLLMAENLRDALWSLELLARRDNVEAGRLGCVGLSYGGRMTMLATAVEPRIRAAVVSGALNVMQERISHRYSCGAQVIPGLLEYGDVPEIASLIAPRPCLWEVGNQDPLMVKDWIEPALERIRRAYTAFGAEDHLQLDRFEGAHRWSGAKAYDFLKEAL